MENRYFLITISRDNLEATIKHNLIGLPAKCKNSIQMLKDGDTIVFYISKKRVGYSGRNDSVCDFGPIAKITGPPFFDEKPIWKSRTPENYPWRMNISIVLNKRVNARALIDDLNFIRNKHRWGLYFIHSIRSIMEEDYHTISKALNKL